MVQQRFVRLLTLSLHTIHRFKNNFHWFNHHILDKLLSIWGHNSDHIIIFNDTLRVKHKHTTVGSGFGSVGRAVASDTRDPRFESSHWQIIYYQVY